MDSQLFNHIVIACAMMGATAFIHAIFVASAAAVFRTSMTSSVRGVLRFFRDAAALVLLSVWLLAAHLLEIGLWAGLFMRLDLFTALEPALYFTAASYTTLGFGDVLLPEEWRLLSGACAASGLLMFGLSAALLFEATSKLELSGDV